MKKRTIDLQRFAITTGSSVATEGQDLKTPMTATYAKFETETEAEKYYDRVLKEAIYNEYTLAKYCDEETQPKHKGKTIQWTTQDKYVASVNKIVEGVVPKEDGLNTTYYHQAHLASYGGWIRFTDEMDVFSLESGLPTKIQRNQGAAVGEKFQQRLMRVMQSSKCRWFAGINPNETSKLASLETARANVGKFNLADFIKIKTALKRMKVKPYDGTHYLVLVSPEAVESLSSLIKTSEGGQYTLTELSSMGQAQGTLYKGEIGTWNGFKFVEELSIGDISESKYGDGTIHGCVILGKKNNEKGTKVLKLEGTAEVETIVKPLGSAGSNDPLNQIATIAWKQMGWGAYIAYDEAVMIYECLTDYSEIVAEMNDTDRATYVKKYDRSGENSGAVNTDKAVKVNVQGKKQANAGGFAMTTPASNDLAVVEE